MRSGLRRVVLATAAAGLAGCGGAASAASATGTTSAAARAACEVRPGGAAGPVTDPGGPYSHDTVLARTSDGLRLSQARTVIEHASVPDGVRMPDGTLRIYYVNGAAGSVWVARVDRDTVTPVGPIRIDGVEAPAGVVDPDATLLPDGRVRLAYLNGFGPPGSGASRAMCLADSADGESFTVAARALEVPGSAWTDPSLVALGDGSWMMAVSAGQQTVMARSADGLTFNAGETLSFGGVPEVTRLDDGRLRLYVCNPSGVEAYASADAGRTWARESVVTAPAGAPRVACDPSRVAGTDVFIYKAFR